MLAESFDIWLHKRGLMMQTSRWPGNSEGHETAYQVYGLSLDFDEEVLAAIHKRKTREHHPDAGGDREQFERYQRAYEVLTDPTQRFDERKREEERLQRNFSGSTSQGSFEDGYAAGHSQGRADTYAAYSRTYADPAQPAYTAPAPPQTAKPLEFSERMIRRLRIVHAIALGALASLVFLAASLDAFADGFTRIFATALVVATFALTYRFSFKLLMRVLREPSIGVGLKVLVLGVGYGVFLLVAFVTNILGTMVALIAFLVDRVVRKFKRA